MSKIEDRLVKEAHILLHPVRFRILELLAEKPMYISELSKALGEDRRFIPYHLRLLENHGFLSSKYEISEHPKSRGKAIRKYWVNGKVEEVLSKLKKEL